MNAKFIRPTTLTEALRALRENAGAAVIAGGTDLMVAARSGKASPTAVIDITGVAELRGVRASDGEIRIGATATYTEISASDEIRQSMIALKEAADSVGSPQIRNRGTIGGSLANATPSADIVPVLAAFDAMVDIRSLDGERTVRAEDIIIGSGRTILREDELITLVRVPTTAGAVSAFDKIGRRSALSIARINGACVITMEPDGERIADIRISLGAVADRPMRFRETEDALRGAVASQDRLAKECGEIASKILEITGRRSSSAYKLPVAEEFAARLITTALERGRGR